MAIPQTVSGREVVFGGGPAAAAYAATRRAMGFPPVIVVDSSRTLGGMFAKLVRFGMNSANWAGVESVRSPGPTRVRPMSPSDDLNYIPNSKYQVRDMCMSEYPDSFSMARAVRETLKEYAETYTSADLRFDSTGIVFARSGASLGRARRIIFAGGLREPANTPRGPAIMSGFGFLQTPVRELEDKKIAVVGAGATGAQCVELMVGGGDMKPVSPPGMIAWYGGDDMPVTKSQWMMQYHARYAGLGRHFPQDGAGGGIIRPVSATGTAYPAGNITIVNGEVFDLVLWCTGFEPAPCPAAFMDGVVQVGGMVVARCSSLTSPLRSLVFTIGTAANLDIPYLPIRSRFPAANNALYNLLPRVAALAGALPA